MKAGVEGEGHASAVLVRGQVGAAAMSGLAAVQEHISSLHPGGDGLLRRAAILEILPVVAAGDDPGGAVLFGVVGEGDHEIQGGLGPWVPCR